MTKDNWVSVRCSDEEKKDIETEAKKQGRSIGNFMLWLFQRFQAKKEQ